MPLLSVLLDCLRQSLYLSDLQGDAFVMLDHGAKLSKHDELNAAASFFDLRAEFLGLDHLLGRGGERIHDRLGRTVRLSGEDMMEATR